MSLSIMEYEERLERIEFMRNSDEFLEDLDFFSTQYCEAFAEPDAEDEAQGARDPQESDAYEITTGEQASNTFTTLPKATNSPVVVEEEAANTLAALPEVTHSPVVVAEEADWAASLFGDEQEPFIAEDEDSFPDQNTPLTDQTDSSAAQKASPSPTVSTPKSNTGLSLELSDEHMIRDVDFEDALKKLGCQIDEYPRVQVEVPTQLPKSRRYFKDFPKYSPQKPQDDIQNPVQQAEQPINDVKQTIHQIEKQVPLVEAVHQAKYTMQQAQPTQQAQLLHMNYTVRPIDVFQSVNYQAVHVEQAVPDMQSQVSPVTGSNSPSYSELEAMDGVLSHELNEKSYIVPEEQSEHGLAGLFGLTLDQAKSGMRNKKTGVRNTVIEKPQPNATHSLLQYAGIKKSKSPKAKVATSHNQVENEEQKGCPEPTVPLTGNQNINKPGVATPAMINLPPHVTYEQLVMIHKIATSKTKRWWQQAVEEGIRRVQQHNMKLVNFQAASQLSGQQVLNMSPDYSVQLNPYHLPQRGLQALQVEHTDQNCGYARQPHLGQKADYASMSGNHAASDNLQQNRAYLTPGRSPMQVNQDFTYNTPQGACLDSHYSAIEGSQGASYSSPQITPRPAGQASPYGSPNNASQGVGQQSLSVHHMAAFNTLQQSAQMGIYSEPQHAWLFPQQGQGDQLQASYPRLQQARQAVRYYAPLPAQQPMGRFLQYDPQNQAQVVAQQYRMQQNQIQCQQTQQSSMQQHLTMQNNLNYSVKMAAQASASKPKHGFTVNDFIETQRH